jgi:NADH-quinone oxidoreductase subunit L
VSATTLAWLALALPLAGSIVTALGFRWWRGRAAGYVGTAALFGSFACAVGAFLALQGEPAEGRQLVSALWDYAATAGLDAQLSILVDPLSILMLLVVTGVSALIHLYAVAYMGGDHGYTRFFSYLNFFVFSMVLLVLAGNFLVLIIGWAFVGAASYLLISFWYRRATATAAGIKAFVINVLGDVGLVLGAYFLFRATGTLDFLTTFERAPQVFAENDGDLVAGCILLLVGAFAKSAQVPLHTWLPDAMEGPTPVSALIHAATMVTAGVYLIARMHPLFELAPTAGTVGAIIGCATLLIAATTAMAQTDLKRVIAYSTMSQIGYMVMAVSAGAYVAGLFHLMTHAFFKALLFMAAGSVIAAMAGRQDMDHMGGFRRAMPFTFGCFVIGGLALAGVPPFSGFFSKDEILAYTAERGGIFLVLVLVGYIAAFLTAVYTFRMIFRTFLGEPVPEARELQQGHLHHPEHPTNPASGVIEDTDVGYPGPEHHVAEQSPSMKVAMGALAVLAVVGGFLQIPTVTHLLDDFLEPTFAGSIYFEALSPSDASTFVGLGLGTLIALAGIATAWLVWVREPGTAAKVRERLRPAYALFVNKWWFDELIGAVIVRPARWLGSFALTAFERLFVQGTLVGGTSGIVRAGSAAVRAAQSGFLRFYVALFLGGMVALTIWFLAQA